MSSVGFFLLLLGIFTPQSISQNMRSIGMSVKTGWEFQCENTRCLSISTTIVSGVFNCKANCLAEIRCQVATYHKSTSICELIGDLSNQNINMSINIDTITMIVSTGTRKPLQYEGNWLVNGDAETGSCQLDSGVTHPTGWNYNGTITQANYNNTNANQMFTTPGPNNRGMCHFYGQVSGITSMWQTVNMTTLLDPLRIDSQSVWFDFSAWIGGLEDQDDYAVVALTFLNQANQNVGNTTELGPVLAVDRNSTTSLLFRQAIGIVPIGARSFTVRVTITRVYGTSNDGDIDSIVLHLYQ